MMAQYLRGARRGDVLGGGNENLYPVQDEPGSGRCEHGLVSLGLLAGVGVAGLVFAAFGRVCSF